MTRLTLPFFSSLTMELTHFFCFIITMSESRWGELLQKSNPLLPRSAYDRRRKSLLFKVSALQISRRCAIDFKRTYTSDKFGNGQRRLITG